MSRFVQMKRLRTIEELRDRLSALGADVRVGADEKVDRNGPLSQAHTLADSSTVVGNRFAVLPMEGWDATADGRPTDLVRRRWRRFGASGAKLVWGGEAVAVHPDGRANPNQLVMTETSAPEIGELRSLVVDEHRAAMGSFDDLVIGLQLTHSGRWARPSGASEPLVARPNPVLDPRAPGGTVRVVTDTELDDLVEAFVSAAVRAREVGFDFVDVKHCHGYLLHELLSAVDRPGAYGGDFEGRTRFLRSVVAGIARDAPGLAVGVRLSAFDSAPFKEGDDGVGTPEDGAPFAFGTTPSGTGTGIGIDLTETHAFLDLCADLGIAMVAMTGGSPYYNPHLQRPAYFPPSDGYAPPEDPLLSASRHLAITADLAARHPQVALVGSGYSYFQQWLPHIAQHAVRTGATTFVGIGRNMLSYPEMPADVLAGRELQTAQICRTFSDCTTAPRNGMVSGCYPLDPAYKERPERIELASIKKATRKRVRR